MIFKVLKWCPEFDYHECEDSEGNKHRFDLNIANCIDLKNEQLVGKTFEAPNDRIDPYISIVNRFWQIEEGESK